MTQIQMKEISMNLYCRLYCQFLFAKQH